MAKFDRNKLSPEKLAKRENVKKGGGCKFKFNSKSCKKKKRTGSSDCQNGCKFNGRKIKAKACKRKNKRK